MEQETGGAVIPYDRSIGAEAPVTPAQRALGMADLSTRVRNGASRIDRLFMSGSAKLLFPRVHGCDALDAVLLNSAGGITGGDDFSLSFRSGPGACLRLTTQAAERLYRAPPGDAPGRVSTALTVDGGACLHWLPQETILYDGGALNRRLTIDMADDATLVACESFVFGRVAMGERVRALRLRDRIDLSRGGGRVFADRLRLDGDAQAVLARDGVGGGAGAMASVLFAAPEAEAWLDALRALLPDGAGVSSPTRGVVFLRLLAADGFAMRAALGPVLTLLTGGALPRPWIL